MLFCSHKIDSHSILTYLFYFNFRLFHYDAAKNQSRVLLDDLWFPNGVVMSPNNDFVVVSESFRARMMKYYISGPKKGKSEVFVDGLPGTYLLFLFDFLIVV